MDKKKKIILYIALILLSIGIFSLVMLFNIDGALGFIMTMVSIYLFVGCIIKLCKLSQKFKDGVLSFIFDILFWLP